MDFSLDDDHLALRDAVQRFCDGEYPPQARGNPESSAQAAQRHQGLAELGLLGLTLPAELGGSGQGAVEAGLVAQELGRVLAPGNWLANAVLAGPLLAELGTPAQCSAWLPRLAAGELQLALACNEPHARYELADVQTRAAPASSPPLSRPCGAPSPTEGRGDHTSDAGMSPPARPCEAPSPAEGRGDHTSGPGMSSPLAPPWERGGGEGDACHGWVINGAKSQVLGGDSAQILLVVARTAGERLDRSGLSLFAVDAAAPGVRVQPITLLDGRRAAHLQFTNVQLVPDALIGPLGGALPAIEQAVARANAALCAEAVGALDALLEMTCEHLRTRKQFGAPLAKFQALQHRIADMAIALEQLKSMAAAAAMALDAPDRAQRIRLVSAAKALTAQLGRQCGLSAIQLHGAMGMTDECRASHYAKRLITIGQLFGDAAHHLSQVAGFPLVPHTP